MLLSCLQSWENHEQSASAAALEQSSFGILSAETLAEASAFAAPAGGASFAGFHNITASLKAPSGTNNDSTVFKMPAVRRSKKEAAASTSLRKMAMDKNMKDSHHPSGEASSRRLQGMILGSSLIRG